MFTAAGIIYSKRELEAFTLPHDQRLKKFYLVSTEDVLPFGGDDLRDALASNGLL